MSKPHISKSSTEVNLLQLKETRTILKKILSKNSMRGILPYSGNLLRFLTNVNLFKQNTMVDHIRVNQSRLPVWRWLPGKMLWQLYCFPQTAIERFIFIIYLTKWWSVFLLLSLYSTVIDLSFIAVVLKSRKDIDKKEKVLRFIRNDLTNVI